MGNGARIKRLPQLSNSYRNALLCCSKRRTCPSVPFRYLNFAFKIIESVDLWLFPIKLMQKVLKIGVALLVVASSGQAQAPRPTLADASPYVTKMNGGKPVDCTAAKVKINFGSGRGEGYCQAVLADLIKSWEAGTDATKLDVLTPADQMPPPPPEAYELKGDKLGSSMSEYLRNHHDDCVSKFSAPPEVHHSVFSGNTLQNTESQHANAFRFACQNLDPSFAQTSDVLLLARQLRTDAVLKNLTLATAKIDREQVEFSQQRLYLVAYYFRQESFGLIQAAFINKFGQPTSTSEIVAKNLMGAELPRTTMTWKNGVSTIELSEISGNDLTKSQVVIVLDEIYEKVAHRHNNETLKSVQSDM